MNYFNELLHILNAMSPYLLLGFFIAGLLHVYLPQRAFSKYLSKKGFRAVFLSTLFGVPLPLCSCGVVPTAMSLKKEGATDGATVSFLIATPQTGIDSILATYGVLGLPFAIIRPIVALVVGVAGGLFVDRLSHTQEVITKPSNPTHRSQRRKFIDVLDYGFVHMLQDLGKWLTIGLIIAAAITAYAPTSVFEFLGDYYLLNILVVLLLSIPMYICSTGSIPIALSLLMMGITPGAALVFLMAGPATNVATLAVLKKVLGTRTTLLYLLSITLGAIGFALLIDLTLPPEWFTPRLSAVSSSAHCTGSIWWQSASSILFIALLINAYILKFRHGGAHSHHHGVEKTTTRHFKVEGMRCNHCKTNVEQVICALPNTLSATADLTTGVVEVEGQPTTEKVFSAVKALGFEVSLVKENKTT